MGNCFLSRLVKLEAFQPGRPIDLELQPDWKESFPSYTRCENLFSSLRLWSTSLPTASEPNTTERNINYRKRSNKCSHINMQTEAQTPTLKKHTDIQLYMYAYIHVCMHT